MYDILKSEHVDFDLHASFVEGILSTERNVIVSLPPGSGKTFIAYQLLKHYLSKAIEQQKKIVFLANTETLLHEQATYFRDWVSIKTHDKGDAHVREFTGEVNKDIWDQQTWGEVTEACEILVMTSHIFLDIMKYTPVSFKDVILLILDDCHNADTDHPVSKIMELYKLIAKEIPNHKLPRVVGLTSKIIERISEAQSIATEMKASEDLLCCKLITYNGYQNILKLSTKVQENYKEINFSCGDATNWDTSFAVSELHRLVKILDVNSSNTGVNLKPVHLSLEPHKQFFINKPVLENEFIKVVEDVIQIADELGPYCARIAAVVMTAFVRSHINSEGTRIVNLFLGLIPTHFDMFICRLTEILEKYVTSLQIQHFVSNKLKCLMNLISDLKPCESTNHVLKKHTLCGIVFVEDDFVAEVLELFFQDAASLCGNKFQLVRPASVIGGSGHCVDRNETITVEKRKETILQFHTGQNNLIFAANVVKDGVNLPNCNIIQFDILNEYPSYLQSQYSALNQGAVFYTIVNMEDKLKSQNQLQLYCKYNEDLAHYLTKHTLQVDEGTCDRYDDIVPMMEAIELVNRCCISLSSDVLAILAPIYWWEPVIQTDGEHFYRRFIRLPSVCMKRNVIEGRVMKTKYLAERSVYLEACVELIALGVLDNNLHPVSRIRSALVDSFFDPVEMESTFIQSSFKIRNNKPVKWYKKKIPELLVQSVLAPNKSCFVFAMRIKLRHTNSVKDVVDLYDFDKRKYFYCIITQADLRKVPSIALIANVGDT